MAKGRLEKYAHCGAFGHAWYEYPNSTWRPEFGTPMVLRCERCGTERRDSVGTYGQLIQRNYDYPMDYQYKGEARPERSDFRLTVIAMAKRRSRKPKPPDNIILLKENGA